MLCEDPVEYMQDGWSREYIGMTDAARYAGDGAGERFGKGWRAGWPRRLPTKCVGLSHTERGTTPLEAVRLRGLSPDPARAQSAAA